MIYRSEASGLRLRYSHALFAPVIEFEVTADRQQGVLFSRNSPHGGHYGSWASDGARRAVEGQKGRADGLGG